MILLKGIVHPKMTIVSVSFQISMTLFCGAHKEKCYLKKSLMIAFLFFIFKLLYDSLMKVKKKKIWNVNFINIIHVFTVTFDQYKESFLNKSC